MRRAVAIAIAGALSLAALPAGAHLMPPGKGTVNVVGNGVFTVVSVPAAALASADDDHDGAIDAGEFQRHEAELQGEIDRRLTLLDGARPARTVRVDLVYAPDHALGERAAQIVALKHAELDAPPADLRVRCDLFGAREADRELSITATRHPASGTETDVAVLRPGAVEHAFFPRAEPAQPATQRSGSAWTLGALAAVAAAIATRSRRKKSAPIG